MFASLFARLFAVAVLLGLLALLALLSAGLLAGLHALAALRVLAADGGWAALPFERIVFVANPDEEVGSPCSTATIEARNRLSPPPGLRSARFHGLPFPVPI